MEAARLVHDPSRAIHEFDVYELDGGRWRAVHKSDRALVIEHDLWVELAWACVAVRIRAELQRASDELAERLGYCEHGRLSRVKGPLGGINV